jgi:hypothetical protein
MGALNDLTPERTDSREKAGGKTASTIVQCPSFTESPEQLARTALGRKPRQEDQDAFVIQTKTIERNVIDSK